MGMVLVRTGLAFRFAAPTRNPAAPHCNAVRPGRPCPSAFPILYADGNNLGRVCGHDRRCRDGRRQLSMTPSAVARRREVDLAIQERTAGIITESRWLV